MAEKKGAGGKLQEYDKESGQYGDGTTYRQNTTYDEILNSNTQNTKNKVLNETGVKKKEKGIRSLAKNIKKHKSKIQHPELYIENWDILSDERKQGILNFWQKEISRYEKEILRIKKDLEK